VASVPLVKLGIVDGNGHERGALEIRLLPGAGAATGAPPLVDDRGSPDRDPDLEPVQLLEEKEYLYSFAIPGESGPITTDKPDLFWGDTERGDRGRLRTDGHTGAVRVRIEQGGASVGTVAFEVRSSKLDYVRSYRWMLRDVAATTAELVMDRFTPSEQRFAVDDKRRAETLYQRFAFLRSLIEGEAFQASIHQILTRPYVTWEEVEHVSPPAGGIGARSAVARSLAGPGPRVRWPGAPRSSPMRTLPATIVTTRTETSVDNPPNRFVRFALEQWRAIVADIGAALGSEPSTSASVERGIREVAALLAQLDALLAADLFREVKALTYFPAGNQVLLKRDGYRHLLSAYAQFQLSARLAWPGMEDVYSAGQRNVATLYEYWVYLQLGKTIARLCNRSFDLGPLIEPSKNGLTLRLRAGEQRVLLGTVNRLGRTIRLELWFNRTFSAGGGERGGEGSWTRPMRPDCSLRAAVEPAAGQLEPLWVHFDAKYRVDTSDDAVGPEPDDARGEARVARTDWLPATMVKMHAYKDAIRNTVGAYVVYPGVDGGRPFREHRELLPGLGAFALRPAATGDADGSQAIFKYIDDVLSHLALQSTQHERARYWGEQSYAGKPPSALVPAVPFLVRPPADMRALLGYTKSAEHRAWIARALLYNLRADSHRSGAVGVDARELSAHHLIVYGDDPEEQIDLYRISSTIQLMTAEHLKILGYPTPRGERYFCLALEAIPSADKPSWLDGDLARRAHLRAAPGVLAKVPVTVSWLDLFTWK
jgi:predicted component of viral defense system (DUF524 family)